MISSVKNDLHNNVATTLLTTSVLTCFPLFLVFYSSLMSLRYYFNSSCETSEISHLLNICVSSIHWMHLCSPEK